MADEIAENTGREYPKAIYKDGKLSDETGLYRIVNDEAEEEAAMKDGFYRHDVTAKAKVKAEAAAKKVKAK